MRTEEELRILRQIKCLRDQLKQTRIEQKKSKAIKVDVKSVINQLRSGNYQYRNHDLSKVLSYDSKHRVFILDTLKEKKHLYTQQVVDLLLTENFSRETAVRCYHASEAFIKASDMRVKQFVKSGKSTISSVPNKKSTIGIVEVYKG